MDTPRTTFTGDVEIQKGLGVKGKSQFDSNITAPDAIINANRRISISTVAIAAEPRANAMTDLAIIWTNGRGDIAQDGIDMLTDDSLTTDVTISLFTDRRSLDSARCRMVQMIAVDGGGGQLPRPPHRFAVVAVIT
ncbi:phage protein GP46 [Escherichia coli]|uniref:Phage protein GP46 n=1 Tax=Escherichia coli TaxID=562 RepID=A0A2X3K9D0_ECOLX|nr:phage protein GP46 [Escherichia coli]